MSATRTFKRWCQTCGWAGVYDSAKRGNYAKKRHSCEKQLADARRRNRGEQLRAAVDRTPKPCLHKIADHQHGTYSAYVLDRCRCVPCTEARSAWERTTSRQKAYGRWDNLVDAEPARAHVRALMDQGMGLKRIVAVSDISQGLLWKLIYGKSRPDGTRVPSRRIRKDTLERILAVELDLAGGAKVDALGTRRRLQALVAIGYSQSRLAQRLGVLPSNFGPLIRGRRETTEATRAAVVRLYDELSMTPAVGRTKEEKISVSRSRRYAAEQGWPPPLAWDDETLDFAEAAPATGHDHVTKNDVDEFAVERVLAGDMTGRLTVAERREVVRRLHAQRLGDPQIARRAGFNARTVLRIRHELGLPAIELDVQGVAS